MTLRNVSLDDKYRLETGRIFITGTQALVRLPLMQHLRDKATGQSTAGYVSGYRGSPLGGYDQQLWAAKKVLAEHHIVFQPGVNEDLAATAIWGTQQAHFHGENKYDGVFAIWYGKGPGVDRTGDAFRHGNLAGTHPLGGVLVLMGDDHTCESSTTAHQSEFAMVDAMIPVLNPAGVQELLDYGIYGWALSRYSGCWVGLKCMKDTIDASASVEVNPQRVQVQIPADYMLPPGGLSIRWPDVPLEQEARLHNHKMDAVRAFARANKLDRLVVDAPAARLGIVTCGKSYMDVRQALQYLGIDDGEAQRLGLRIYKVGMTWPLEPEGVLRFAQGLSKVIVVEEKRALIESQLKDICYGRANMPQVVGKRDESGGELFQSNAALDPNHIAAEIGRRILELAPDSELARRVAEQQKLKARVAEKPAMDRTPYFCSGCPHNSGTRVVEGSRALSGIGCHFMAQWMDRNTAGYTQMGGEGASWIGEAPFVTTKHVFQNIGDGTYFHSGLLALRAVVASGVNVTYKILYNDAVAMTGGQHVDGNLSVPQIAAQVLAEGGKKVAVVTDEPDKYGPNAGFPPGVQVYHRDDYDAVQREMREIEGCSVIVYDQRCAAEKRRRRKRNLFPDPPKRVVINDLVCEGCGDCGVKSNCVSVLPLETEFGRKRTIDQSSCNKDYSCVKGFCPSFVTVQGAKLKRGKAVEAPADLPALPEPAQPAIAQTYSIIVTGVGGTGIVTIGGVLGMAAHLEGKGIGIIDQAGLAQKGGAVYSHIRIARRPEDIHAIRVAAGECDLVLGGDMVVVGNKKVLSTAKLGATTMIINTAEILPGDFTRNADFSLPTERLKRAIRTAAGAEKSNFVDATRLATALLGNSIGANIFMVGYAYQLGALPLSSEAIEKAIELNGEAVPMNLAAFQFGRRAAHDLASVEALIKPAPEAASDARRLSQSFDETVARRVEFLTAYQNADYAARYKGLVQKVQAAEVAKAPGKSGLAEAVARYAFKLMAYKDEYEVARLYAEPSFLAQVKNEVAGENLRLKFHLAPPLLARKDKVTGVPRKMTFGSWMLPAFRLLAKFKFLRGTALDIFGYSEERRTERKLIGDYEALLGELIGKLTPDNHAVAVGLAAIPEKIRGFGHVKARHLVAAKADEAALLEQFRSGQTPVLKAAE